MTGQNGDRPHRLKNVQYPATVMFVYYALLNLFTGTAVASTTGFLSVLCVSLLVSTIIYVTYRFFVCRDGENKEKMWFLFALGYLAVSYQQLGVLWQMLTARAA